MTNVIYDGQDRLIEWGDLTYTYTADGTLFSKTNTNTLDTSTYTYDAFGQLTGVDMPTCPDVGYIIDALGRRVGRTETGQSAQGYLYHGKRLVAELDNQNTLISRFAYGTQGHVPDILVSGSVVYRLVTDQLGSVHLVINTATGEVAQQLTYDAWGKVLSDSNPGFQPFGGAATALPGGCMIRSPGL